MAARHFSIVMGLIAAAGLTATFALPTITHAGVVDGAKTVDDLMIYLGVVPAATVRGHPKTHDEAKMHGGAPASEHSMHVVAAVFDNSSGARITEANVSAHITEPGGLQRTVRLEPMVVAGALTYGGFAKFQRGIRYRIGIKVDRPAHMAASKNPQVSDRMHRVPVATAHFAYTHD